MSANAIPTELFHELIRAERGRELWEARQDSSAPALLPARLREHARATVSAYAELAARPFVTREDVRREGRRFHSTAYDPGELVVAQTSGTTGIPLAVPRDPASFYGFAYDTYTTVFKAVPELSGLPAPGSCAVVVINDNPQRTAFEQVHPALNFARTARLILYDEDRDQDVFLQVVRQAPALLYGRPRSLSRLARVAERSSRLGTLAPRAILCSGDNLHADERAFIESAFHAPVYNAYASLECGFLALECAAHQGLHVLPTRAVVEVLPEGAAEVQPGGSGELVITGLENWAMPMIRYRSGDWGTVCTGRCGCGHSGATITQLSGRDSTYFILGGARVNPSVLNPVFESLPIRQFQVVQEQDDALHVRWVPAGPEESARTGTLLAERIREMVGGTALSIACVQAIGRQEEKVQRYVRTKARPA